MEIKTNKSKYVFLKDLGILVNSEIKDDFSKIKTHGKDTEEEIRKLRLELTDKQINDHFSSCCALILILTEQCNFRCKYCSYSGKYDGERTHRDNRMSFETAKKAIDMFLKEIGKDKRPIKRREVSIGFYGGEPLLEFNLMKEIVDYIEQPKIKALFEKRFEVSYRMTTNGYLLNKENIDYLKEKDFVINVSIDGSEKEHDKFRVTRNGGKTWAKIMENLKYLKGRYPEFYEKNVSFLATIHPCHDCKAIDDFFSENREYFPEMGVSLNPMILDRLNDTQKQEYEKIQNPMSDLLLVQMWESSYNGKLKMKSRKPGDKLTGTCIPGSVKLLVSPSGEFGVCEKACDDMPKIGNVDDGLYVDVIRKMMKDYNEEIIRNKCWECDFWFFCSTCTANEYKEGGFKFDCSALNKHENIIKRYLEKKEVEDDEIYLYCDNSSTIDFLEQL